MKTKLVSALFISMLLSASVVHAQSTYGQAKLKCKECLLLQILRQADDEFKDSKFGNAIPYYNLYLTMSGDKNPAAINKLAESYWQNRAYDSAAAWFKKIETPVAKERLAEIAVIKQAQNAAPADAGLKFFVKENSGNYKPADSMLFKENNNYTVGVDCGQQYKAVVCGSSIFINSKVPKEAPQILKIIPPETNDVTYNKKNISLPSYIIHFDFDKYSILPKSYNTLDSVLHDLKNDPKLGVVLIGHTDLMGSELYNEKLAVSRAEIAEAYLMSVGIDKKRIISKAFGKRIPLIDIVKPIWENRRVEIYFIRYGE